MDKSVNEFKRDHYDVLPSQNSLLCKVFTVLIFAIPLVFALLHLKQLASREVVTC